MILITTGYEEDIDFHMVFEDEDRNLAVEQAKILYELNGHNPENADLKEFAEGKYKMISYGGACWIRIEEIPVCKAIKNVDEINKISDYTWDRY